MTLLLLHLKLTLISSMPPHSSLNCLVPLCDAPHSPSRKYISSYALTATILLSGNPPTNTLITPILTIITLKTPQTTTLPMIKDSLVTTVAKKVMLKKTVLRKIIATARTQ